MKQWALPSVLILLMAVGTVWLRLHIVRVSYEIDQTDKMIRNAQRDRERAEVELAKLKSPRRLELLAKTRFHLGAPRQDQLFRMSEPRTVSAKND